MISLTTQRFASCLALFVGAFVASAAVAQDAARNEPQKLDAIPLNAGMIAIHAELAKTPSEREIGMMFRKSVVANDGMLFAFEEAGQQCFWMKNTLVPLSIAFIDDDGSIVNLDSMKPQTLDGHCSTKPVRFVLEMSDGWFGRHGVKPGSRIQGAPFSR